MFFASKLIYMTGCREQSPTNIYHFYNQSMINNLNLNESTNESMPIKIMTPESEQRMNLPFALSCHHPRKHLTHHHTGTVPRRDLLL